MITDFELCIPNMEIIPQIAQLHKLNATLPDPSATPFGDMKIPEPEIVTNSS